MTIGKKKRGKNVVFERRIFPPFCIWAKNSNVHGQSFWSNIALMRRLADLFTKSPNPLAHVRVHL